ncbi:MAG: hypothetical protein ACFCUU_18870 [Cyclobacteriaceae bacterium]
MKKILLFTIFLIGSFSQSAFSQTDNFSSVKAEIDFSKKVLEWDGFGVNYVQMAQSLDLEKDPQDYGGLNLLSEAHKEEVIELIFGNDGLKPGLLKMFLDPWHQTSANGSFDHTSTTESLMYFAKKGLEKSRDGGRDLNVITTMYGPPAFVTIQKEDRGRDLDPKQKDNLAKYYADWAKYLVDEGIPLKYVSLHNEGEGWMRWEVDGISHEAGNLGHDYNLYWPKEQVVDFLKILPETFKKYGLKGVEFTPGETYSWDRFYRWGYADEIAEDEKALNNMGLITSHGFLNFGYQRWNSQHTSAGTDLLRAKKPGLHAWVTSTSWSKMDSKFAWEIYSNIYISKSNGVIPWAILQRPAKWYGNEGDPNPGCAIWVKDDGSYEIRQGYFSYKQLSVAGQPGMTVVKTNTQEQEIAIIGFGSNGTQNPDAFVVIHTGPVPRKVKVELSGTSAGTFQAYRTTDSPNRRLNRPVERYNSIGNFTVEDGAIYYEAPENSITTFYGD